MEETRYVYKPKLSLILLVVGMFGGCMVLFASFAIGNTQGLVINHVIELSVQGASIFFWMMASLSAAFVVVGLALGYRSIATHREVKLGSTVMSSPKNGISSKVVEIAYHDITALYVQTVQGQDTLHIQHAHGKLAIPRSMLPNKSAFEEMVGEVQSRANLS